MLFTRRAQHRDKLRRRANVSVQLIFILPLLVLAIVAAVQFSIWSVARQTVNSSAIDGARVAATGGTHARCCPRCAQSALGTESRGAA